MNRTACPLCCHDHLEYQFTQGGTPVVSCAACGLLMRNLPASPADRGSNQPVPPTPAISGGRQVIALDSIERTRDPMVMMQEIWRELPVDSQLLVTAPDLARRAARLKTGQLDDVTADRLYFFDNRTLQSLLFRAGFDQIVMSRDQSGVTARRSYSPPLAGRAARLSVVMPVFNERETFHRIFEQVYAKTLAGLDIDIVIIESNSSDGTRELVQQIERRPRVSVIYEDRPRGKGHAVRAGLEKATGDLILIQDADLEYDVNDYDQLVEPIVTGRAAFVLGVRHGLDGKTWKMRHFADQVFVGKAMNVGHLFFTGLFNVVYGQQMRDPFTMFKVFRRDCLHLLTFESNRFDFDWELVAKLVRAGYIPLEIPVNYESRSFSKGKKVSLWRDPWTFLRACFKYRFVSLGK